MSSVKSLLVDISAGSLAACGAVTLTNPFEVVKIRLQLQGELVKEGQARKSYTGVFQALRVIAKYEGFRAWQKGLGIAYVYQIALNGCRLGLYEPVRGGLTRMITGSAHQNVMSINMFSGAICGILGACIGSPFFLIKTRLQSHSPIFTEVGTQHIYKGPLNAFQSIWKQEGIKGLYRGMDAALLRTGAGSSVQLPSYNFAKRQLYFMDDGPPKHLLASAFSGFGVCCVMHPFDVVMTRMYNQKGTLEVIPGEILLAPANASKAPEFKVKHGFSAGGTLYKTPLDCLVKTIKFEGPIALYKGFSSHLPRIVIHTVLTLTLMEQTMKLMSSIADRVY
ncbi:Mitochondrial oxaloacetate transport protein [Neolecta irregularis DAH-3]|uniref:Mitochondrial oxaloacetate transport protein n=1 Tax=Neolecta irregularis (strain DAH-3) TaxID=1198029 RepID=A0A1U7LKG0_NEOID|nr:Mitochondrial oxaloacetate transport protein [Neolecta irregularis DAH-3]|eukprot:OLL23137.1 Mitochondrial oxaloacetate transport protein [Neolecta irregularis DAH-3]